MAKFCRRHLVLLGVLAAGLLLWELLTTFRRVDEHCCETHRRINNGEIYRTADRWKQEKVQQETASLKSFPTVTAKIEGGEENAVYQIAPEVGVATVPVEATAKAENDSPSIFLEKRERSWIYYAGKNFSASVTPAHYLRLINTLHGELSLRSVSEKTKRQLEDVIRSGHGLKPYITKEGETTWIENGIVYRPWHKPDPSTIRTKYPNPYVTEYESYIPFDEKLFFESRRPDPGYKNRRKILLWHTRTRYIEPMEDLQPIQVCPDFPCYITTNKKYSGNSSAMIFAVYPDKRKTQISVLSSFDLAQTLEHAPPRRRPDQIFILHSHEPPYEKSFFDRHWRQGFKQPGWKHAFNWTMTYRMDSDLVVPYGIVRRRPSPPVDKDYKGITANKTRLVAWLVSNCQSSSRREEYVKELRRHITIDVFGGCTEAKCPHQTDWKCSQMISEKYKFYIGFETAFCQDYITEKIFHFLTLDTITLARGSDEYFHHVPREIYFNTADFPSPKALAERLLYLHNNDTAYIEMLKEKDKYMSYMEGFPIRNPDGYVRGMGYRLDSPAMCLACLRLWNLEKYAKSVPDSHRWFALKLCRKPQDLNFLRAE